VSPGRAAAPLAGELPDPAAAPSGCGFRTRCPHAQPACAVQVPALRPLARGQHAACLRDDVLGASAAVR